MRYQGKPGSKKWRGMMKRQLRQDLDAINRVLAFVGENGNSYRLKVVGLNKGTLRERRARDKENHGV